MKRIVILCLSAFMLHTGVNAQEIKMPAASPTSKLTQQFSTTSISVDYSRPSVKGRKIFGEMIPFGKLWRTGANGNTKITFEEDVFFQGQKVPAGTYSLYTMPGANSWTVILNKGLENWGLTGYDQKEDVARVTITPIKLNESVETLTIDINDITNTSATMNLSWENTKIPVQITADNKQRILSYLESELKGEKPPYQQAANYYLEQNYKLNDALAYADKAINGNKDAFWLYWMKAKIQAKMGDKNAALQTAQLAADKAKGSDYEGEYKNNLEILKKELK